MRRREGRNKLVCCREHRGRFFRNSVLDRISFGAEGHICGRIDRATLRACIVDGLDTVADNLGEVLEGRLWHDDEGVRSQMRRGLSRQVRPLSPLIFMGKYVILSSSACRLG